jgi:Na+-transporting NADH:ubiquinone oxidoreductase subunit NqrD
MSSPILLQKCLVLPNQPLLVVWIGKILSKSAWYLSKIHSVGIGLGIEFCLVFIKNPLRADGVGKIEDSPPLLG